MEEILIIVVCLLLNAMFACFEMAFVTVGKPELQNLAKKGNLAAAKLLSLRQSPERTLSVVQVGITFVGIISAAAGGAGAEESLSPYFEKNFGMSDSTAEAISILIIVFPLTFINVIFGELVPKTLALRHALKVSTWGLAWITWVDRALTPFVYVLEKATKGILYFLPKSPSASQIEHPSANLDLDHLSQRTQQYVLNLVGIENRNVMEMMVPWNKVEKIEQNSTREQVAGSAISTGHTRLPVVNEGKVVGLLHTKELMILLSSGHDEWHSIIRPLTELPPQTQALSALRLMQNNRSPMCVVSDGDKPIGALTLEDILEEIVGEIYDEDDDGKIRRLLMSSGRRRVR